MALTKQAHLMYMPLETSKPQFDHHLLILRANKHNNTSKSGGKNERSRHATTKLQGGVEWRLGGFSLDKQIK